MLWKLPPKIKIYEALGAIADQRIQVDGQKAEVTSSSLNKTYQVEYHPDRNEIVTNDNGSYWQGYLGYPAIAYLLIIGKIKLDKETCSWLKNIPWKDLNVSFKNDYEKTIEHIHHELRGQGLRPEGLDCEVSIILEKIKELKLKRPAKLPKPPTVPNS